MQKLTKNIVIALLITVMLSFLFSIGLFSNLQTSLSDSFYGGLFPREDIIIIAIDDNSLQEIGRWPWDRENFAEIIPLLNQSAVLGIDVAFFEKSNEKSDNKLIKAAASAENIVLPVEYTSYRIQNNEIVGGEMLFPIEGLEGADAGYINIITDKDGVSRALNLDVKGRYDSFAAVIYKKYTGKEFKFKEKRFLVNFVGIPGSFQTHSFVDVLKGNVDTSQFKDKIVLMGATSPDLHDDAFTPTSAGKAMPGVEIHANTLQTMLDENFLAKESKLLVIISMFIAAAIALLLLLFLNTWIASLIIFFLIVIYIIASIFIFTTGTIMNIIYPILSFFFTTASFITSSYLAEKKEKKHIVDSFGKYVSPVIVKELVEHPEKLKLGGEKREITVLFSDIRDFTSLSEKLKPEKLVDILNQYLTEMTKVIMANNGLVDKYIGDAIMAFWGAPLKEKDHPSLAFKTCIAMVQIIALLNKKFKKQGKPFINIGIGLNTGNAVVGNMGSEERFDYTAMGDEVNLGSRLEGLTKVYQVPIIISEHTKEKIKDFSIRELDVVAVKGKKKPIKIYELMPEENKKLKESFAAGLKLYRQQKWDAAMKEFRKNKDDHPSKIFIERCLSYKKSSPGKEWDEIWVMKGK